jgi:hypothetical protein
VYYLDYWFYRFEDQEEIRRIEAIAKRLEIGGKSFAHRTREERMKNLSKDQKTGMYVQAALAKFWYNDLEEYFRFMEASLETNFGKGDNGSDLENMNIDAKGSCYNYRNKPENYHLIVNPKEFRKGWVYVFGLYFPNENIVGLMGWATSGILQNYYAHTGNYSGNYVMKVPQLTKIKELEETERVRYLE